MVKSHVESVMIPGRRLGRRPHNPDRPTLRLESFLTGAVPPHPSSVDHLSRVPIWGMLGNSQYGDCGPCMIAHDRELITQYLSGNEVVATLSDTLDLYRRSGNPAFPADDNGVVLADMLSEVARNGFAGTRTLAYAQVNVKNLDEVRAAISIFGSLHLGVDLLVAQQAQTDHGGPWDYQPSPVWGGHAVLAGAFTSDSIAAHSDISVVTWGTTIGTTDAFWMRQVVEGWVCIWPEHLGSVAFQEGVDLTALAGAYKALTGRPFPIVTPPSPPPTPTPTPVTPAKTAANDTLAAIASQWVQKSHWGAANTELDKKLTAWLSAWGYR